MSNEVTIYGASDDLIEFDGAIYGEADAAWGSDSTVILTAPDRSTLILSIGFCNENPDGWAITVKSWGAQTPSWPMRFAPRPDRPDEDPAIIIDVPEGTVATCDGETVS